MDSPLRRFNGRVKRGWGSAHSQVHDYPVPRPRDVPDERDAPLTSPPIVMAIIQLTSCDAGSARGVAPLVGKALTTARAVPAAGGP